MLVFEGVEGVPHVQSANPVPHRRIWRFFSVILYSPTIFVSVGLRFKQGTQTADISYRISVFFLAPYKAAFDCLYKLLLITVTLPVTSASCERSFSKMKLVKTFLRNSMTSDRLSNIALLSIESKRAESIDMDSFVDEFDSRHANRRIKLH